MKKRRNRLLKRKMSEIKRGWEGPSASPPFWLYATLLFVGVAMISGAFTAYSGLVTTVPYSTGSLILAREANSNQNKMVDGINSVESAQLVNGTIVNADMACGAEWQTITDCDASAGNADAMHAHDASAITISTSTFSSSNMEDALGEVANFVGYSAVSTNSIVSSPMYFIDYDEWVSPGFVIAGGLVASLTASQTQGINGVLINLGAEVQVTGPAPVGGVGIADIDLYVNNATQTAFVTIWADDATVFIPGNKYYRFDFVAEGFTAGNALPIRALFVDRSVGGAGATSAIRSIQIKTDGFR